MRLAKTVSATIGVLALMAATGPAHASAPPHGLVDPGSTVPQAAAQRPHHPRASLRVDVGQAKPWVGQAIPVTVTAYFRGVEGVTLEGAVQLTSKGIMTSELGRQPKQGTEIIDGEPTLAVKWSGTVTPSGPGPLDLSVDLPVRIQYREAAPPVVARDVSRGQDEDDPFAAFGGDPFGSAMFNQMRRQMEQMVEQPRGRVVEQTIALKASARTLDVLDLPAAGQPVTFSGAVGRFDLKASLSSAHVHVSDPVTLRVVVEGTGDLDRVDLPGVSSSDTWKAYPPKATREPASGRRPERKVFEQVLVPLRGGDVTVPAVSLTAFDPTSGHYVTRDTSPLQVSVEGTTPAHEPLETNAAAADAAPPPPAPPSVAIRAALPTVSPWMVGIRVLPVLLLVFAAAVVRALGKRRKERTLRRTMTRAASQGSAGPFFDSAHRLIEMRLAERWALSPEEITANSIRERLGSKGDPLVEVIAADEALRFARGGMEGADLQSLCSSVQQSLRGAS